MITLEEIDKMLMNESKMTLSEEDYESNSNEERVSKFVE
jgi:hypothetical protein